MEESRKRIEELENKISNWQEELDTIWNGKNTDVAEVERINLKNLINNAKREIDELNNVEKPEENMKDPEEFLEQMKAEKEETRKEKGQLERHAVRLEEERENYKNENNAEYKAIYDEYTKQIEETRKRLEEIEKEEKEEKDKDTKIRILTKGKMDAEKEVAEIKSQIEEKEKEISKLHYATEREMEEIETPEGEKKQVPVIHRKSRELDELKKTLREKEGKVEEFEKYINELKGITEEKIQDTAEQNHEKVKYFHEQGDVRENSRNDKRTNDEHFGVEANKESKSSKLSEKEKMAEDIKKLSEEIIKTTKEQIIADEEKIDKKRPDVILHNIDEDAREESLVPKKSRFLDRHPRIAKIINFIKEKWNNLRTGKDEFEDGYEEYIIEVKEETEKEQEETSKSNNEFKQYLKESAEKGIDDENQTTVEDNKDYEDKSINNDEEER